MNNQVSHDGRATVDEPRARLIRAQTDARARVDIASNGIVRMVVGGCTWNDDRTRAHRTAFAMARVDLDAATNALVMLDQIDAEAR